MGFLRDLCRFILVMRWFLSGFRTINSLDGGSRGEGEGNYEIKEIFI